MVLVSHSNRLTLSYLSTLGNVNSLSSLPGPMYLPIPSLDSGLCEPGNQQGHILDRHTPINCVHLDNIALERKMFGSNSNPCRDLARRSGGFGGSSEQNPRVHGSDLYGVLLKSEGGHQSPPYGAQCSSLPAALMLAPTSSSQKNQRPSKQKRLHFKQAAEQMIKEIKRNPLNFNMEEVEAKLPIGVANNLKAKEKFMDRIRTAHTKAIAAQQRKAYARSEIVLGRIISL